MSNKLKINTKEIEAFAEAKWNAEGILSPRQEMELLEEAMKRNPLLQRLRGKKK